MKQRNNMQVAGIRVSGGVFFLICFNFLPAFVSVASGKPANPVQSSGCGRISLFQRTELGAGGEDSGREGGYTTGFSQTNQ